MNRTLVMLVLSVGMLGSVSRAQDTNKPAAAAAPTGAPKIVFDKTVYDFGTTSMVSSLTGTFTFHNGGDATLELKKPTTSCGCTVAGVKPQTLKPGEKGELIFTMNVGNITRGHAEKHITVPSNDAATPSVNLTVRADIVPTFDLTPTQVPVGDIRQGVITNMVVQVKRVDGKKVNLSKVEATGSYIHATVVPVDGSDGTAVRVVVEINGQGSPRRFNETVRGYGDNPSQPVFQFPVYGRLVGDVTVNPEAVFWGIADPEHWPGARPELMTTRTITVTSNVADKPLAITNPSCSLTDITMSVSIVTTDKVYQVIAKLAAPPKDSERGSITFSTGLASQPTVTVPVTVNVLKH
jgi:hypothetical protein